MKAGGLIQYCKSVSVAVAALVLAGMLPAQGYGATNPIPGGAAKPEEFEIVPPWGPGITHTITQAYGSGLHQGTDRSCCNNDHYALDADMHMDEPVYPVAGGRVMFAGPAAGSWATFGNIVLVDHLNGFQSFYAHLNSVHVATGQAVDSLTTLGGAGGSGGWRSHLHFALYKGAKLYNTPLGTGQHDGQSVVPEPFASCVKASGGACENLGARDRLLRSGGALAAAAVTVTTTTPAPTMHPRKASLDLSWVPLMDSTAFHIQLVPMRDDGPGMDLIISDPGMVARGSFRIEQPKLGAGNYILLPGAYYTWRVRQTLAFGLLDALDAQWGPWSQPEGLVTPRPAAETVNVMAPSGADRTPTIRWNDSAESNFYYEVQVSSDPQFRMGSDSVAFVYWNLVHGGITEPLNSWRVPDDASLEPGAYYARVRPRVQATPAGPSEPGIAWSQPVAFEVTQG